MYTLNGWQRLWVVVSLVLLAPTALIAIVFWPNPEADVTRDLRAVECKLWRDLPADYRPANPPAINEPCRALRDFLYLNKVNVRSVADYERFITSRKARVAISAFLLWTGTIAVIYVAGWSVAWVRKGFRQPAA